MRNPQLNDAGELQHLLTLEGMPAEIIERILDTAVPFVSTINWLTRSCRFTAVLTAEFD